MIHDVKQRTPAWYDLKKGRIGGSEAHKLMAFPDSPVLGKQAQKMLVDKMFPDGIMDDYQSAAMTRGIELEPAAIAAYTAETWRDVREVGYVSKGELFGCSPDGMTETSVIEIKCPMPENVLDQVLRPPVKYVWQVYWCMWVTGMEMGELVFFDGEKIVSITEYHSHSPAGKLAMKQIENKTRIYTAAWNAAKAF